MPSNTWKQKKGLEYADLIHRYKVEFPYLDDAHLAAIILKREKLKHTVDTLRTIIPYARKVQTDVSLDDNSEFTFEVPESVYKQRERFIIPSGIDRLLFISDIHIPYHDITAVKQAIKYGYDNGMRGIFLGGDIVDFYGISRYQRLPHLRNVSSDINAARQFLHNLRDKFPDLEIYYKIGNHEARWANFLIDKAPEIFDLDSVQLDDVLHLTKLRIKMIDSLQVAEFGRLNILHGHEIMGGGVHVARNFRIKASDNILFGNFHRTKEDITKTIKDKIMGSWAVGCLCYSDDTEILTEEGFKLFKDVSDDNKIGNFNPSTKEITLEKPKAKQVLDYNGDLLRFYDKKFDLLVTPDHKMLYKDHSGNWKTPTAEDFYKTDGLYAFPISGKQRGDYYITEDEANLIGWVVTEGTIDFGKKKYPRISIYQKKQKETFLIRSLLNKLNLHFTESKDKRNGVIRFRILSADSKNLYENLFQRNIKRLPRTLLNSDYKVLIEAFNSIVLGDGVVHRGSIVIATKDFGLANDYVELCHKIGFNAWIKEEIRDTNLIKGATVFLVKVRQADKHYVGKKEIVRYSGKVYDFTSNTGFLVVRRNGKIMISSNCGLSPDYMPINDWNLGFAFITREANGNFTVDNKKIINGYVC